MAPESHASSPAAERIDEVHRQIHEAIPAHRQRKLNPQIKLLDLPATELSGVSSLFTKNRIAKGTSPVVPFTKSVDFGFHRSSLSHLRFKKNAEQHEAPPPQDANQPSLELGLQLQELRIPSPVNDVEIPDQFDPDTTVIAEAQCHPGLGSPIGGDHSATSLPNFRFPEWLHEFLPKQPFCVWFAPFDGTQDRHGTVLEGKPETKRLLTILDRLKAKNVGYRKDLRVIFVHVGAIQTLHQLDAFRKRRFKCPHLQFITYGSHPTVPISRWGIREIYVLGSYGIVPLLECTVYQQSRWDLDTCTKCHRR